MIKLKKIINQLDQPIFTEIESALVKSKAENFLHLLQSYRKGNSDDSILTSLNLNSNSFYVLKSRLYDKIQGFLSGDVHANKEEVTKSLHRIPEMCFNSSREVATAFLEKLEQDLLYYDMHNELLVVYSALKKIHLYSEKYFHYSQLYNKHLAFSVSLEKSEEILGNFNRMLGEYNFSRSGKDFETLLFLRKGINDHFALNQSRQIELIRNIIDIQLEIFCNVKTDKSAEILLNQSEKILEVLPESSPYKKWDLAVDYLAFEFYFRSGREKQASVYFEKVDQNLRTLLLYTNICLSSQYLMTRVQFLQRLGKTSQLAEETASDLLHDESDSHGVILLGLYRSMVSYYNGRYKEVAAGLNSLLNINSFKDFFHINTEIKLQLSIIYIRLKEYDLAENLLKNIQRKIKSEKMEKYNNVLDLIKVISLGIKNNEQKAGAREKDHYTLFTARNNGENRILSHFTYELEKKYS